MKNRAWIGLASAAFLAGCGAENLSVGNIASSDDVVSFTLANDGDRNGDVVLWIEQGDFVMCERVTAVEPHHSYTISFACPSMSNGAFMLRFGWASMIRERAVVAVRIE